VFRRYPDSIVEHRHADPVGVVANSQSNLSACVRVLGRVGQEVRKHLRQPHAVTEHEHGRRHHLEKQLVARALDCRPAGVDRRLEHGREIELLAVQRDDAARDARHFQQSSTSVTRCEI
jgi:hypothetical protein